MFKSTCVASGPPGSGSHLFHIRNEKLQMPLTRRFSPEAPGPPAGCGFESARRSAGGVGGGRSSSSSSSGGFLSTHALHSDQWDILTSGSRCYRGTGVTDALIAALRSARHGVVRRGTARCGAAQCGASQEPRRALFEFPRSQGPVSGVFSCRGRSVSRSRWRAKVRPGGEKRVRVCAHVCVRAGTDEVNQSEAERRQGAPRRTHSAATRCCFFFKDSDDVY
ncbi:hypothetical protein EYF80_053488 [Liparis tanakae]|uniref:Uncharacterized protein n=1 Tax=Liparis tanakae TaxID=230148 RepID=A0A4Z2F5F3_9TELE|nr:hypothetical protein EYF80_053488 [Liparis tanakae]